MPSSVETPTLTGRATAKATDRFRARFAKRFDEDFYRKSLDGLFASSIGIGTYLGESDDDDDARYFETISAALASGVNLIDTAINYRCQRSELTIGRVLNAVVRDGIIGREEVIVCTKAGYIPLDRSAPPTRAAYQSYVQTEFYDNGVMDPTDVVAGGHCISPRYLGHQLSRSRTNLGLRNIDLYYLHNPEQQLDVLDRPAFLNRIRSAFAFLEERVSEGDIGRYGCATWNGFRVAPEAPAHLSLEELVQVAIDVGGKNHHFRAIQLPINLGMVEAVRLPTQRLGNRTVTLLEAANHLGIAVVASASLLQSRLTSGLPEQVRDAFPTLGSDAQRALTFTRSLPAVSAALVGMKSVAHLEDNLKSARTG
jgi:aryl-alcohol dehydrogenase-like predicted oxidoreductase